MKNVRIVSLVPSLTELLVHLGLEENLVGVTKFCVHPKHLKKSVSVVGGTKNPNHSLIEELNPTHIIANREENNKKDVEIFKTYTYVHVTDIKNIDDILKLTSELNTLFFIGEKAELFQQQLRTVEANFRTEFSNKKEIPVAYFIWKDPWMSVGSDTFINYMLSLVKFKNISSHQKRYPEVALEDISTEVILLSSEPFPFKDRHCSHFSSSQSLCFLVNGEYFSWYGNRILDSFIYLKELRIKIETSLQGEIL